MGGGCVACSYMVHGGTEETVPSWDLDVEGRFFQRRGGGE